MNTATIAAHSTVTSFTQNLKTQQPDKQTAKEAIASNVQTLIEQLEQGHSEVLTAYPRLNRTRQSPHLTLHWRRLVDSGAVEPVFGGLGAFQSPTLKAALTNASGIFCAHIGLSEEPTRGCSRTGMN